MSTHVHTPESLKQKAKIIRSFMKETCGADISHGHSLELISKLSGFKDWNTASAASKPAAKESALPIHIETVSDLKRALEMFEESDTIDADYEFKLKDLLEQLDEADSPEDTVHQEFALSFEQFNDGIVTFKLELKNEDIHSSDGQAFVGRSLR